MCDKRFQILPVYLADVADGDLRINWGTGRDDDGAVLDYSFTCGLIANALNLGKEVHIVGWSTFGSDPSEPLGYMTVSVTEIGTGKIMDNMLVTTEDTAECRVKLRNLNGITLTIDGAGATSECVLQMLIEIERDC